jgi:F-type H+-transporting ATPase subunit alpha
MNQDEGKKGFVEERLDEVDQVVSDILDVFEGVPDTEEIGRIASMSEGIVKATGLSRVRSEELVYLGEGSEKTAGLVLDILPDGVGIVLLDDGDDLSQGHEVLRSGKVLDVPVGDELIGRVVDPLGRPLDGKGAVHTRERLPVQREAHPIMHRAPVTTPLEFGIKVVDAVIPVGRGQRELILGDRQTGKTALALDAIANQKGKDCLCIYCAIGRRSAATARVLDELERTGAMDYSVVMVAEGDRSPGLMYTAPYAAASMAEHFMEKGRDVLVIYDDLTKHAVAYRQISLLLRRPPGREAYPGDIFYVHSRLLERATRLRPEYGGGSVTALPIIETEAQNLSAYIPTNLISITDGQIYLNPVLFRRGVLPAVDVGKSVSRVGGKAQPKSLRRTAGDLKLSYASFQELEAFARFGTRLDDSTRKRLEHGRRVREILKQDRYSPLSTIQQAAVLHVVTRGLFDEVPLENIAGAQQAVLDILERHADIREGMSQAEPDADVLEKLEAQVRKALGPAGD